MQNAYKIHLLNRFFFKLYANYTFYSFIFLWIEFLNKLNIYLIDKIQ